jgi:hypothetical protein
MEKYNFDINKADQIFTFLLREKQIQLSPNHNIMSADELKNKKYYKWHNSTLTILTNARCSVSKSNLLLSREEVR